MLSFTLRKYREKMELTQKQLAEVLNIDRSTYSYYETGKSVPPIETLIKLARIFNTTVDNLLGYEREENEPVNDDTNIYNKSRENFALLSEDEQAIIMKYRQLSPEEQSKLNKFINSSIDKKKNKL